ncbi:MAG: hypothetical protein QNK37_09430 [Acidobacteriota bacterium]|nr:hypothetical protein [Acidobacteriota bacterium]
MSHQAVETFIGEVLENDYQTMCRAIVMLEEMTGELESRHDGSLVTDILKLTELLDSRTRNHFQLEERMGACAGLAEEKPRLESQLRDVIRDHRLLEGKLAGVRAAAREIDRNHPETFVVLGNHLRAYTEILKHHEERESMMVLEAANTEIGAAD